MDEKEREKVKVKINSENLRRNHKVMMRFDGKSNISGSERKYRCSFCGKEFKSAQALGGHMNVHRRDRAKMRLITMSPSSSFSLNPNPNTTPACDESVAKLLLTCSSSLAMASTLAASPASISKDGDHQENAAAVMLSHSHSHSPRVVMKRRDGDDVGILNMKKKRAHVVDYSDQLVWMKKEEEVKLGLSMGGEEKDDDDLDLKLRL